MNPLDGRSLARKRGARVALAIVLLAGCSTEPAARNGPVDTVEADVPDSTLIAEPRFPATDGELDCQALGTRILAVHPTRAALRDRYGAPDSVNASVEPNRHMVGATDSLFVVHYPGLAVHIRTPPGGRDLVSDVFLHDGRYLADARFGIGASEAAVRAALGEPMERSVDEWTYECGTAVENPVTLTFRGGIVTAISISYYVD